MTVSERDLIEIPSAVERLAAGMSILGGEVVAREALLGGGLTIRDDVVHLAPGISDSVGMILEVGPRSYTAVEPDPLGASALRARGARVLEATVDETGLDDECASLVIVEGVLSDLDDADASRVLAEAVRLIAPRGRLVVREIAGRGVASLSGRQARSEDALRDLIDAAGLDPRGAFSAPLGAPDDPWPLVVRSGPKVGLKLGREVSRELSSATGAAERLRRLRRDGGDALNAVVILAEKCALKGFRWPSTD